jgi:hypothetical protein
MAKARRNLHSVTGVSAKRFLETRLGSEGKPRLPAGKVFHERAAQHALGNRRQEDVLENRGPVGRPMAEGCRHSFTGRHREK